MSGHSKWSTIKHKKGNADAKRGKIFTKITKEIMVSAKLGGADPASNPRLRTAIVKARASNMPKDTIEKAIKKGVGDTDTTEYFENIYEGYGPHGVAIMVETLTDNKNRTAADIRSAFTKAGGNLGESGCVSYMFNRKGVIIFESGQVNEDELFEKTLDLGAEDFIQDQSHIEILCSPDDFETLLYEIQQAGYNPISSELALIPDNYSSLGKDETERVIKLLDTLEDNDDVQTVSSNLNIADDIDL